MNIQFMTAEKNGIPTGEKDWRGEERYKYIPDFKELISNASCEEEVEAICKVREMIQKKLFDGFTFEIVFTAYRDEWDFTEGHTGRKTWQLLQHPWYRSEDGVYKTKEEMLEDIEMCMKAE